MNEIESREKKYNFTNVVGEFYVKKKRKHLQKRKREKKFRMKENNYY